MNRNIQKAFDMRYGYNNYQINSVQPYDNKFYVNANTPEGNKNHIVEVVNNVGSTPDCYPARQCGPGMTQVGGKDAAGYVTCCPTK